MNAHISLLAEITPLFNVGGSMILSWLITLVFIAAIVAFCVWIVTKITGAPPNFPEWFKLAVWGVVIIGLIVFTFAALGLHLP